MMNAWKAAYELRRKAITEEKEDFLYEVSREAGHKYTLHKTILLNVPYFTFGKLNFPNLFVNIC